MLTLGSLFDGIGGWQLAAKHAGVEPIWSSEIEPFPCAVTAKHFPNTVQLGDITKLDGAKLWPVDIVCAGSPCQDLSVAGKQEGLKGARSGLFRNAVELVRAMRMASGGKYPRFFVFENVPGLFSSNKGFDFRAVLEEITEAEIPMPENNKWADAGMVEWDGGSLAWRILDAQYWGVPQRRRRIFLVADFGGRCAGEILFEREGVHGDSSQSGKAREGVTAGTESGIGGASVAVYDMTHADEVMRKVPDGRSPTLNARMGTGGNQVPVVSYAMQRSDKFKESQVAHTLAARDYKSPTDLVSTYTAGSFAGYAETKQSGSLKASGGDIGGGSESIVCQKSVRRLTPLEAERLQGLPDGYTLIDDKTCSDTARYKALGNGMAQPCADFVIRRIVEAVEDGQ